MEWPSYKTTTTIISHCYLYCIIPDEKSHGNGLAIKQRRQSYHAFCFLFFWAISDDFWAKEPRHSKTTQDEQCHLHRRTRPLRYRTYELTFFLEAQEKKIPTPKKKGFFFEEER